MSLFQCESVCPFFSVSKSKRQIPRRLDLLRDSAEHDFVGINKVT